MFKRVLIFFLSLTLLLYAEVVYASNSDLLIPLDPNGWSGSGLIAFNTANSSLVWQPMVRGSFILTRNIPLNWNSFNCIKFDCYSRANTNSWIYLIIGTEGNDYFYSYLTLNWTGWKSFALTFKDIFSSFAKVGNPDLGEVKYFAFQSHPDAYLEIDRCLIYLSNLKLSNDSGLKIKEYGVNLANSKESNLLFNEDTVNNIRRLSKESRSEGLKRAFEEIVKNAEKISGKDVNLSVIRDAALVSRINYDNYLRNSSILEFSKISETYWDNLIKENDILVQEEFINYVITYDLLRSEINNNSQLFSKMQKTLVYVAKKELDVCRYWISYYPYGQANNHVTRAALAAGIASVVMNGSNSEREQILNSSLFILERFFNFQISEEGVLNEGTHYYTYLMEVLSYFAYFLKNATGKNIFTDFSFSERLRALIEWSIKIRMPDGFLPCIDDSWQSRVVYPLRFISDLFPFGELLNWSSINVFSFSSIGNEPWNLIKSLYIPLYLATYKENLKVSQPLTNPSLIFPSDSEAVLRENWGKDSAYLFLAGKSLFSLHEHDDVGNIQIYAYNSPILITSGYGPSGWSSKNRNYYVSAQAHNVVEIDGIGPKGYYNGGIGPIDKSSISDFKSFSKFDFVKVNTGFNVNFKDTYWDRYVYFLKNSNKMPFYAIIIDRLNSNNERTFTTNFHPFGNLFLRVGKTTEYNFINLNGENLTTKIEPIFDCNIEVCKGFYSPYWDEEVETRYLKYKIKGKNATFGTVIFPYLNVNKPEEFQTKGYKNGVVTEFKVSVKNKDGKFTDYFTLDESKSIKQLEYTGTNAKLSYIRKDELSGLVNTYFIEDGSYLNLNQKEMFYSDKDFNYLYFSLSESLYKYYCEFELNYSQSRIFFNVSDFDYALLDGKEIKFEKTKKGVFLSLPAGKHILTFK